MRAVPPSQFIRSLLTISILLLVSTPLLESVAAKPKRQAATVASLSPAQQSEVETLIGEAIAEVLPLLDLMPGQVLPSSVDVDIDRASSIVTIELGTQFLPSERQHLSDLDEQAQTIMNTVITVVGLDLTVRGGRLTFGGKETFHYYPAESPGP